MCAIQAAYVAGEGTAIAGSDMWLLFAVAPTAAVIPAIHEAVGRGLDAVTETIVEEGLRSVGSFVMAAVVPGGFRVLARGGGCAVTRGADPVGTVTGEGHGMWTDRTLAATGLDLSVGGVAGSGDQGALSPDAGVVAASHIMLTPASGSAAASSSTTTAAGSGGHEDAGSYQGMFAHTMHGRPSFGESRHLSDPGDPDETTVGRFVAMHEPVSGPHAAQSTAAAAWPESGAAAPSLSPQSTGWGTGVDPLNRTLMPGEQQTPVPREAVDRGSNQASWGDANHPSVPPPPPIPSWTPPPAAMAPPPAVGAIIDAVPDFSAPGGPVPAQPSVRPPVTYDAPAAPAAPAWPPAPPSTAHLPGAWSPQPVAAPAAPAQPGPGGPAYQPPPPGAGGQGSIPPAAPRPVVPDANRTVNRSALHRAGPVGTSQAAPPQVQAAQCPAGHLSPAHAAVCRVCRSAMPPNPHVFWTPRPVLGRLVCSNGDVFVLDRGLVLGRSPVIPDGHQGDVPNLVKLVDHTLEISSQHVEIRLDHWMVLAIDLGSTNGTDVRAPGREPVRLVPGVPELLEPGAVVSLADVLTLTFEVW